MVGVLREGTEGETRLVLRALRAGAAGFLLKDTPPEEIVRAIEFVDAGDSMLSPTVTRRLIDLVAAEAGDGTPGAEPTASSTPSHPASSRSPAPSTAASPTPTSPPSSTSAPPP